MSGNSKRENREVPSVSTSLRVYHDDGERSENVAGGTTDMNADGNSDESIVPAKWANKDVPEASAESVEERDSKTPGRHNDRKIQTSTGGLCVLG